MTDYEKLLKLIEANPTKVAELYEIDARSWCYFNNKKLIEWPASVDFKNRKNVLFEDGFYHKEDTNDSGRAFQRIWPHLQYTRSRDALKSARPEGLHLTIKTNYVDKEKYNYCQGWIEIKRNSDTFYAGEYDHYDHEFYQNTGFVTEELAELHVIIQAIEWERIK